MSWLPAMMCCTPPLPSLSGERETLRSRYQRRPVRSRQRDALVGRNDLHIDQCGKLLDEIVLRVHQGAGILVDALEIADLLIDTGDLRGQAVHLSDRLHDVLVDIAALGLKILSGRVEVGGQRVGRRQHALPQRQVRGIGGELLQTVKEIADVGADAGTGARELGLQSAAVASTRR